MNIHFQPNTLYYGDCLDIMEDFPAGCIDLICLDPPFNSKRQYNQIFRNSGLRNDPQIKAFDDTWQWNEVSARRVQHVKRASANPASKVIAGFELHIPRSEMLSYTSYMAERLYIMHRILKDTGSIYLHCDPTASHFLKLVLDAIFGADNFGNEIIWHYNKWTNAASYFQRNHDTLLFYSKDITKACFNKIFHETPNSKRVQERGWDSNKVNGKRQLLVYDKQKAAVEMQKDKYDIIVDRTDKPKGTALPDVWHDLSYLASGANERLGYPTQKPTALYKRIIEASSNPDDLILDPFAGCGTTIEAALKNNRRVIGIDILPFALRLINDHRIKPNGLQALPVLGIPVDIDTASQLVKTDAFKFQDWAVSLIDGFAANPKKVGDDGIDGFGVLLNKPDNMDRQGIIVQVTGAKGSQKGKYDRLHANIRNENAAMGVLITLNAQPASRTWTHTLDSIQMGETAYPPIQCFSIEEYFRHDKNTDTLLKLPPLANPWTGKAMPQPSLFDVQENNSDK